MASEHALGWGAAGSANTIVESWCFSVAAVFVTTLSLITLNYVAWRIWVSARARRHKAAGRGGSARSLPAPVPVLPAWCGFLGGHSLIIQPSKVFILYKKIVVFLNQFA